MTVEEKLAELDADEIALSLVKGLSEFDNETWRARPETQRKAAIQVYLGHELRALIKYLAKAKELP